MHRVIPAAICLILALSATVHAQIPGQIRDAQLPGAKQIGPSCGFYANIPALTSVTGINIADGTDSSLAFIKSVYGLRNGDFKIQTPFKKELFFTLFGIEAKTYSLYLPQQRASLLLETTIKSVEKQIIPALQQGHFISARVNGQSRRPHNILLLGYRDKRFSYHNPTTGKIYTCGKKALAEKMLSKSTLHKNKVRPQYFIQYLSIPAAKHPKLNRSILPISKLPTQISIRLSEKQKREIDWVKLKKKDSFIDAIDSDLKPSQLTGITHLARLSLHAYHSKHRDLLPVMLLDGKPQLMIAYQSIKPVQFSFFDGEQTQTLNLKETLMKLKSNGIKFGYLSVPH